MRLAAWPCGCRSSASPEGGEKTIPGAIAGDVIGSVYERNNHRSKRFELSFAKDASFTDDTVHTVAVMAALMGDGDIGAVLLASLHQRVSGTRLRRQPRPLGVGGDPGTEAVWEIRERLGDAGVALCVVGDIQGGGVDSRGRIGCADA